MEITAKPHSLLHQLCNSVFGLRPHRQMVCVARHQGSGTESRCNPLLLYACLRVNGLMFLMPGLVSPDLPAAFAVPTAYGDLTAVILALLALACVRYENALAVPMV